MAISIRISTGGKNLIGNLDKLQRQVIPNGGALLTRNLAQFLKNKAKANVAARSIYHGRHPGRLGNSIRADLIEAGKKRKAWKVSASAIASDGADYSAMTEYGTKPHEIPNNPAWGMIGRTHPGARPMYFMRDAFRETMLKAKFEGVWMLKQVAVQFAR